MEEQRKQFKLAAWHFQPWMGHSLGVAHPRLKFNTLSLDSIEILLIFHT